MTAVAIDGPAGAGKSTVARAVAQALGFRYLDTGAMYRAIALAAIESGVGPDDAPALAELAASADIVSEPERTLLNGRDVSDRIREGDVTECVSQVAAHPEVRAALLDRQRSLATSDDVVMEGRDIGTVVLPNAEVKIFLTASLEERARRRAEELGVLDGMTAQEMVKTIDERDKADSAREASPLTQAEDAHLVDSTGRSISEVVDEITRLVRNAGGRDG